MDTIAVRPGRRQDAEALLAIYRPVVLETTASFEIEPPSVEEFQRRMTAVLDRWAWLVAEEAGRPLGYAYATPHRARAAYRYSVETSVYVAAAARRRGIGRRLYDALFPVLVARGYCHAYAGIALPNDASVALHGSVGFVPVGVFRSVGRKFGAWHDVSWWHRPLADDPADG